MKYHLAIILILCICLNCQAQYNSSEIINRFKNELEKIPSSNSIEGAEELVKKFKNHYDDNFDSITFKILFFKSLADFYNKREKDESVIRIQKDSILKFQLESLPHHDLEIARTYTNIGYAYYFLGDEKNCKHYYNKAIEQHNLNGSFNKYSADIYRKVGDFYDYYDDVERASFYYEIAENLYLEYGITQKTTYAHILKGLASKQILIGNLKSAEELLVKAIKLLEDDNSQYALNLKWGANFDLSKNYHQTDQLIKAKNRIDLALENFEKTQTDDILQKNILLRKKSYIVRDLGDHSSALNILKEIEQSHYKTDSIPIRVLSGNIEDVGYNYLAQGKFMIALQHFQSAMSYYSNFDTSNVLNNPTIVNQTILDREVLHRQLGLKSEVLLAYAHRSKNEEVYQSAIDASLKSDSIFQLIFKKGWEENSFLTAIIDSKPYYLNGIEAALSLYNLTNAQSHLNSAHNICSRYKTLLLSRGIDLKNKKQTFLTEDQLTEEKKLIKLSKEAESNYREALQTKNNEIAIRTTMKSFFKAKFNHNAFLEKIGFYTKFNDQQFKQIPSVKNIQEKLENDEAILEYMQNEETTYAFLVTKNSITHSQIKLKSTEIDAYHKWLIEGKSSKYSKTFSENILKPLLSINFEGIKKLTIIPDQELLKIPFEVLLIGDSKMIDLFDISYEYSTSFLIDDKNASANSGALAMASNYKSNNFKKDPYFSQVPFSELDFSIDEAQNVNATLGGEIYINESATKNKFLQLGRGTSILHLALHSKINPFFPDQSALIFESDSSDFLLTASEIYNMDLDSDLTVLSACNTAVGKINAGDGIRSLTRSFIHAGSKSVVTSLWETPDKSTSVILKDFYMLIKEGKDKSTALRQAKLNYINSVSPTFQHPKYWAHLVLVGDTSPIISNNANSKLFWILGLAGMLVLFLFLNTLRKKK